MLDTPEEDAQLIIEERIPMSKIVRCHQGSPMERILKSKVNPSGSQAVDDPNQENYVTEDVTMEKFLEHISKLIVEQKA
jgi:protein transport protein SEC23